ncbi:hypothetical protein E2C01_082237 [Portunus trituberculatus]|uniref:Uncharacterized protein n=1 Tax=Portunus trituberculatus TaxID=210409 RepID=A0A5B7J0A0_PORTR|nr:hypothetical protein [Portunus trituberculatus]
MWRKERGQAIKEILTGIPDGPPEILPNMKAFWAGLFQRPSVNETQSPAAINPTLNDNGR